MGKADWATRTGFGLVTPNGHVHVEDETGNREHEDMALDLCYKGIDHAVNSGAVRFTRLAGGLDIEVNSHARGAVSRAGEFIAKHGKGKHVFVAIKDRKAPNGERSIHSPSTTIDHRELVADLMKHESTIADVLISMALKEGMKKPANVIYIRGVGGKLNIFGGNRRGLRRIANFPQTLDRFAVTGPQPESPIDLTPELKKYAVKGAQKPPHPYRELYRSRDNTLGARTTSQQREMRIGLLLPTLAYHSGNLENVTMQGIERIEPNNTENQRKIADTEYHRLLDIETDHVHKRTMRTLKKLKRVDGPMAGRGQAQGGTRIHDPVDHGYTGVPPSLLGELEASHFADIFRLGVSPEESRHKLRSNIDNFFRTNSSPMIRHDLSHDSLMTWSKAMHPRRGLRAISKNGLLSK